MLRALAVPHAGRRRVGRSALGVRHGVEDDLVQPTRLVRLLRVGQLGRHHGIDVLSGGWAVGSVQNDQNVAVRQA